MSRSFEGNSDARGLSSPARRAASRPADIADGAAAAGVTFDYELCLSRLGGDRELFDEILEIFLEDAPPLLAQAAASLAHADWAALERATHTLKGLAANFAAAAAVAAAYALELHARERRLDSATICFAQLEAELHKLEAALRDFRRQRR